MANKKNKQIEQHEDVNLHIKKRAALGLVGTGIMSVICYGWFLVLIDCWNFLELKTITNAYQLMFIPMLLIAFGLAGLLEYCLISIFKKPDVVRLVVGLVAGLVGGLVFGLVFGLIVGLVAGLVAGLADE
jgi:hypothetical protein